MATIEEQIEAIEKEIRETPYDKSTQRHHGVLRARIARLKDQMIDMAAKKSGGGGGYAVKKQGDATVVLVGPPSVGKSTLINLLTNAKSKVAPYAFTTVSVIPGMMNYKNANIQILDVPGLIKGAEEGKGRGREVLSVVRGADLMIIMTDPENLDAFKSIVDALERNGIRINKTPPDVSIDKKFQGGLLVHSNIKQDFSSDTVREIASQFGIRNGDITIREKLSWDELTDAFSRSRAYIKAIFVINKADKLKNKNKYSERVLISASNDQGVDELKEIIWEKLGFIFVYLVRPGEEPNKDNPIIVKTGSTLEEIAEKIGTDFAGKINGARIWGNGAKYPDQEVSLTTVAKEEMFVRYI